MKLASVNPIFYDLASDLDTLLVRPEVRIEEENNFHVLVAHIL